MVAPQPACAQTRCCLTRSCSCRRSPVVGFLAWRVHVREVFMRLVDRLAAAKLRRVRQAIMATARRYTAMERGFVGLLGILSLWSATNYAGDIAAKWRAGDGVVLFATIVASQITVSALFLYVSLRGRGPSWLDRFDLPRAQR